MKTTMKATLLSVLTVLSLSASAQQEAETGEEINAQTTVTRGQIDNILQRINSRKVDTRFNARDYWAQNPVFRSKVDEALKTFEDDLEKNILQKAAYWMDQYNSIALSTEFSSEQKTLLLKQRLESIRAQFKILSLKYQAALTKVYDIVLDSKINGKFEVLTKPDVLRVSKNFERIVKVRFVSGKTSISGEMKVALEEDGGSYRSVNLYYGQETKRFYSNEYWQNGDCDKITGITRKDDGKWYGISIDYTKIVQPEKISGLQASIFQKLFYPELRKSCQSNICLGLLAGDHAALLTLIKTNLDRTMILSLADGNVVNLESLGKDIQLPMSVLARVDYPEELPFDI